MKLIRGETALHLPAMIPGMALAWLIGAFAVLLIPQWDRLPLWLLCVCATLAGWRWLAQTGRVRLPGRLIRTSILTVLVAIYLVNVQGHFTVDTAASFFVLSVGLKWLETRSSRDFYVLFFILVYLASVNFLFEQGILWTLLNLSGVLFLLVGLQIANAPDAPSAAGAGWKRLGAMSVKTLPVVVALFIFFPRMDPLWSVPLVSGQARTGISDTMTPGDISDLAQSSKRAFRVTFGGPLPERQDRYWRGLILDVFDGETWRQKDEERYRRPGKVASDGGVGELRDRQYDVLMEPTDRYWAFALEGSRAVSANIYDADQGLFRFRRPADGPVRYRLELNSGSGTGTGVLSRADHFRYVQLPADGNPRSRELARELRSSTQSDSEVVIAILERFREQSYFYTLRPPKMPEDGIDALLFDVRRGFCAHYAGAMTFLLREAGIPARVVVGYQGGEPGAGDGYLIVRQYDAHAWVEVWLAGRGWVRVDPTAAIAPSRIESGLRAAVEGEGSFLEEDWASPQRYADIRAVRWMSLQMDRINYQWQRWVVGYQGQSQMDLMSRLPGGFGLRELGYFTAAIIGCALLIAGLVNVWSSKGAGARDPWAGLVQGWHSLCEKSGIPVHLGETPDQLARRMTELRPDVGKTAEVFARLVNNYYYGPPDRIPEKRELERGRRVLVILRKQLRAGPVDRSAPAVIPHGTQNGSKSR